MILEWIFAILIAELISGDVSSAIGFHPCLRKDHFMSEKSISRRSFLKGTAAAAASTAAFSLFGGNMLAKAEDAAQTLSYTPGTYTAKAQGLSSEVTVTMTFSEDAITETIIDVSGETSGIGAEIGDTMTERIMAAQSCNVDGVSGATVSSNAVKTAVADCMSQASGQTVTVSMAVDASENADEIVITDTVDADAVVIGCGAAGIHAALTLQAAGVKTIILEKGANAGISNGAIAGGPALAETRVQEAEGETVSQETLYKAQYNFSNGTINAPLMRKCVAAGERVVSNFMDNGVNMGLRRDAYGVGFRARHNFQDAEGVQQKGLDRFGPLVDKFESDGGQLVVNAEAIKLVMDGDAVTGVIVRSTEDKTCTQYNAKAVLVATGGYAMNEGMIKEHFGDINVMYLGSSLSDGKGYEMVIEAGGVADRNWALCCNEFGGANFKMSKTGYASVRSNDAQRYAVYGALMVNANGERFMDEHYLSDRPLALGGEMSLREGRYYAVVDQTMYDQCRDEGILAYFGNPEDWYVGGTGYTEEVQANIDEHMAQAIEEGWAVKGTLAECAEFFGMKNLEKTVEEYNALCEAGEDTQFYKPAYLLHSLNPDETFYVVEYEPSCWSTFGGVKTDAYCRALRADQSVIPGLYVAGIDNGSLYASPYFENEGASLGTAYTSGVVAGDCILADLNA